MRKWIYIVLGALVGGAIVWFVFGMPELGSVVSLLGLGAAESARRRQDRPDEPYTSHVEETIDETDTSVENMDDEEVFDALRDELDD